jgi:hypothetical protein
MDKSTLIQIATDHLLPLFSGAKLTTSKASTARQKTVAFDGPCVIQFKVSGRDRYRLRMQRSQAFDRRAGGGVTEFRVVQAFASIVREIEKGLDTNYRSDLLSTFQRRIVARATGNAGNRDTLLSAIDRLALWATRLYEGRPIAAAIGLTPTKSSADVGLSDIGQTDFSSVLSNGFDTLLSFDFEGRFSGRYSLVEPETASTFAPFRQGAVASWAKTVELLSSSTDWEKF